MVSVEKRMLSELSAKQGLKMVLKMQTKMIVFKKIIKRLSTEITLNSLG